MLAGLFAEVPQLKQRTGLDLRFFSSASSHTLESPRTSRRRPEPRTLALLLLLAMICVETTVWTADRIERGVGARICEASAAAAGAGVVIGSPPPTITATSPMLTVLFFLRPLGDGSIADSPGAGSWV